MARMLPKSACDSAVAMPDCICANSSQIRRQSVIKRIKACAKAVAFRPASLCGLGGATFFVT
ncbi:hypothetical protein ACCT09_26950, partial [Rhizobium ruizarguesonis]